MLPDPEISRRTTETSGIVSRSETLSKMQSTTIRDTARFGKETREKSERSSATLSFLSLPSWSREIFDGKNKVTRSSSLEFLIILFAQISEFPFSLSIFSFLFFFFTSCSKNMDAVLNEYENLLTNPTSQTFKKSQSNTLSPRLYGVSGCNGSAYAHYHSRKRQPNTHRRQCRIEQDQVHSIMKNILHSAENDNICYEYPRSMKNSYKKESYYMRDEHHQVTIRQLG